jgi:hypothetical protein
MSTEPIFAAGPWLHQRCAYQVAKPAMDAMSAEDLIEVDIDVPNAMYLVFGKLPEIMGLRSTVASCLADFDMRAIDKLELYGRALCYANWFYQSTRVSVDRLAEWLDQFPIVRRRLLGETVWLFSKEDFHKFSNSACPLGLRTHMELTKFLRLCCLLQQNCDRVERETSLQRCEIAHAELLTDLASMKAEQGEDLYAVQSAASANRQRAFTLFLRSYDQVRRATQFVRWNIGDADDIAPPLVRYSPRQRLDSWSPPASARLTIVSSANPALPRRASHQRSA